MPRIKFRIVICALLLTAATVHAQDFYQGKTVRIIVGAAAGGGYDTYSRTIARHMGKHIPGNPSLVVENMPGAGFLISANHMYKVAKPDGLTIGHFIGGLFLQQLLGKPGIEFDAAKFDWQLVHYSGAVHSFTHKEAGDDPSKGAAYDAKADARSWEDMKQFFAELFGK